MKLLQNHYNFEVLSKPWLIVSILPFLILCYSFICANTAHAQSKDPRVSVIPLEDLSTFQNTPKHWRIAGDVLYDLNDENLIKEKKGKGILIYSSRHNDKEYLLTNAEHGDMDVEVDFMIPKGSTSAIYLQGSYGIRLNDSWSGPNLIAQASGAIYMPIEGSKQAIPIVPPRVNVCKAPGLWQNLKIFFQAPKFDGNGKKVSNAKFTKIVYNGLIIHENIEVPGVTFQSLSNSENPLGPLMFSSNGGIAIRNIRYKKYSNDVVKVNNLKYSYFEGIFDKIPETTDASKCGNAEVITWKLAGNQASFALKFEGKFTIPKSGTYVFHLQSRDISQLIIDGKIVIERGGEEGSEKLAKGNHTFSLLYIKERSWGTPQLGLFVEGPGIARHSLHDPSSLVPQSTERPIIVEPGKRTIVQRCFMADGQRKRTFCVAVGEPGQIHYAMDLSQEAVIKVWKGGFLDATTMWTGRGQEQIARPLGSTIELSSEPTIAILKDKDEAWPVTMPEGSKYQFKGYRLDEHGRPTFKYSIHDASVEDKIVPENNNRYLTRTLTINDGENIKNLWFRLAKGSQIKVLPNGLHSVGDKGYYIRIKANKRQKPLIRKVQDGEELLLPAILSGGRTQLTYSIIW